MPNVLFLFDILYFTSVANENRNVAIHMFYLAFVIMIYHTQNKSGLLEFLMGIDQKNDAILQKWEDDV